MGVNTVAADELRLLIERTERLNEEIKDLQDDRKDVFNEAKSRGFDVPTMKTVIKLRKVEPNDRRNTLAMVEIYMTVLGMSDGSLSDAAAAFMEEARRGFKPEDESEPAVDQSVPEGRLTGRNAKGPAAGLDDGEADRPPITVEDARRLGAEASRGGRPVTANPFPARDPRRAAWDEAWCQAAGTDGMDIPDFLKPPPKAAPADAKPDEGKKK